MIKYWFILFSVSFFYQILLVLTGLTSWNILLLKMIFALLFACFVYKIIPEEKYKQSSIGFILLSVNLSVLTVATYFLYAVILFQFILLCVAWFPTRYANSKWIYGVIGIALFMLPFFIFDIIFIGVKDGFLFHSHRTLLSDIGIINSVNQLRGEDSNIYGEFLHNKSLYLIYFLKNTISLFSPTFFIQHLLFILLPYFLIGIYLLILKISRHQVFVVIAFIAFLLPLGILRSTPSVEQLIFLLPFMSLCMVMGVAKFSTRAFWVMLIINFMLQISILHA